MNLLKCLCGKSPKFINFPIGIDVNYFKLICSDKNCKHQIETFGCRKKEYSAQLWNATIKRKVNG